MNWFLYDRDLPHKRVKDVYKKWSLIHKVTTDLLVFSLLKKSLKLNSIFCAVKALENFSDI